MRSLYPTDTLPWTLVYSFIFLAVHLLLVRVYLIALFAFLIALDSSLLGDIETSSLWEKWTAVREGFLRVSSTTCGTSSPVPATTKPSLNTRSSKPSRKSCTPSLNTTGADLSEGSRGSSCFGFLLMRTTLASTLTSLRKFTRSAITAIPPQFSVLYTTNATLYRGEGLAIRCSGITDRRFFKALS